MFTRSNQMKRLPTLAVALLFFSLPSFLTADSSNTEVPGGLTVTISGTSIEAAGATPGGTVIFLGVQRRPIPGAARVGTWAEASHDEDNDGVVSLALEEAPPLKSAWAAMDLSTGRTGTVVGSGFTPDIQLPGAGGFELDPNSGEILLRLDRAILQILIIRPTLGAWATRAYDGGRGDVDQDEDGTLRFSFSSVDPLMPEFGTFPGLAASDVIAAIDENRLTLLLLRGADAPLAGGAR
jgi:hypothetical protein